jgi:hypothetical protein
VKRSGRDKSVWVVIHMCMEVMLGLSLYSYPYLKLTKLEKRENRFCLDVKGVGV